MFTTPRTPHKLSGSSWGLYPVDACIALTLLCAGVSILVYTANGSLIHSIVGSLLCLSGAGITYAACGTSIWLSSAHVAQHSTDLAGARTSLRHRRNVGRALPCPYPDAWYAVALSAELPIGGILDAVVCGRSLVVFRPPTGGSPSVLDAYCSHNGAHLAHGGSTLVDDCIRCPFHGWCFDPNGRAVSTGAGDKPPPGSDLRSWPVLERNGIISVWMAAADHGTASRTRGVDKISLIHSEKSLTTDATIEHSPGASSKTNTEIETPTDQTHGPWWEPPNFPELNETREKNSRRYTYHGFSEHLVPALIYELPENGADIVHLTELHTPFVVPALRPVLSVSSR